MTRSISVVSAIAFLGSSFLVVPAYSAGDGGGGADSTRVPNCKHKMVWDKQKKKCVKPEKSSGLSDDNIYESARSLAYARRYEEALVVLSLAAERQTPRMLTYRGFATRKMGDVAAALPYYEAALALNPDYTLAREYMGEAFLQIGRVDLAQEQLQEIAARCGTGCAEYSMLEKQISAVSG